MLSLPAILLAVLKIANWLIARTDLNEAQEEAIFRLVVRTKELLDARLAKARAARSAVDPGRVPSDDPYRRD